MKGEARIGSGVKRVIRINRETDYGVVLAAYMARHNQPPYSASQLAKAHQLPLPTVSKILKSLSRAGLLISQRGARGGYALARDPSAISAADLIIALEGPVAITECSGEDSPQCGHHCRCAVSGHWQRINHAICQALAAISLAELSAPLATVDSAEWPAEPADLSRGLVGDGGGVAVSYISVDALRSSSS